MYQIKLHMIALTLHTAYFSHAGRGLESGIYIVGVRKWEHLRGYRVLAALYTNVSRGDDFETTKARPFEHHFARYR